MRDCNRKNSHLPSRRFQYFPISPSVIPSSCSKTLTGLSNYEAYSTARCEAFSFSSLITSCHRPHTGSSQRFDAYRGFSRSSVLACLSRRCRTRPPSTNNESTGVLSRRAQPTKSFDSPTSNPIGAISSFSHEHQWTGSVRFRSLP